MAVYIIDEMMGRGKTSAAINFVNRSDPEERFLFIVPYLTEGDRIASSCAARNFKQPLKEGGKLNNIKVLFRERHNIVATHVLFQMLDREALDLIQEQRYTLIMDEVADVASQIEITQYDMDNILSNYGHIGEDKRLFWDDPYAGVFDTYREIIESRQAYAYNDYYWIHLCPIELFLAFDDIYVMTYMFEDQMHRCYFDLNGIAYERLYISGNSPETYSFSDQPHPPDPVDYRSLIKIERNEKLNRIGDGYHDLSKSWYRRNTGKTDMVLLKNNTLNFFRNYARTPASLNLWTTYGEDEQLHVDWFKILSGGGYARSGLACNTKGTNDYRERTSLAYLVNRFPQTNLYNFLTSAGIELNRDRYALSEMIQWIWRSAIRDDKEIYLYIPSRRMRELLDGWLERLADGEDR